MLNLHQKFNHHAMPRVTHSTAPACLCYVT